eukprot:1759106-Amphidinium_carterae.1
MLLFGRYAWVVAFSLQCNIPRVHGFKIWKSAHMGIVTVDQASNMRLDTMVLADNHIGSLQAWVGATQMKALTSGFRAYPQQNTNTASLVAESRCASFVSADLGTRRR